MTIRTSAPTSQRIISPVAKQNPIWQDLLIVSRPGWWLVSLWLYLAPTAPYSASNEQNNEFSEISSSSRTQNSWLFWFGLFYVCFPLNLLTYGLNDFADVDIDKHNPRKKENWIFGSHGLSKARLCQIIQIAVVLTIIPLLALSIYQAKLSWTSITGGERINTTVSLPLLLIFLLIYLTWYVLGLMVNISYNFPVFGHMSKNGPFETLVVYAGYCIVTSFSYWVNTPSFQQGPQSGEPILHWLLGITPRGTNDMSIMGGSTSTTTLRLFGCNNLYWIHLGFLVLRTQLWMEYMDYESDAKCNRGTTLVRLTSTKRAARWIVASVLWAEVVWTFVIWLSEPDWNIVMAFSCMGAVLFECLERHDNGTSTKAGSKCELSTAHFGGGTAKKTQLPQPTKFSISSLTLLIAGQNLGGLALLYDVWNKGIFVR